MNATSTAPRVLLIVTVDTKATEARFLRGCLEDAGVEVIHLDASIRRTVPGAEIGPDAIAAAAGTTIEQVRALKHEGKCQAEMVRGALKCAVELHQRTPLSGILAIGGSMGTGLGTAVMQQFPYGMPKIMVSTLASGFTAPYVGTRDITMMNAVCDISGLNTLSRDIYRNAAIATAAMARAYEPARPQTKPLVLISTLGTTERTALRIRLALEERGFEVMVFHTNGNGGATLDQLVRERPVAAVVDLSLIEITEHLVGGLCAGRPDRSKAAMDAGVPLILVPGNTDFMVGGPIEQAKLQFPGRRYHIHNAAMTAVRSGEDEYRRLADHLATLLQDSRGSVTMYVPLGGLSAHDSKEGYLYDPTLPPVLAAHLRRALPARVPLHELPHHINDPEFADALIARVLEITALP